MPHATCNAPTASRFWWLDGIKGISILWIVFFHTFTTYNVRYPWTLTSDYFGKFMERCNPESWLDSAGCFLASLFVGGATRFPCSGGISGRQRFWSQLFADETGRRRRIELAEGRNLRQGLGEQPVPNLRLELNFLRKAPMIHQRGPVIEDRDLKIQLERKRRDGLGDVPRPRNP